MKLFLDTVNIKDVIKYQNYIDGITTNPSLISKEIITAGKNINFFWSEIFKLPFEGGISVQVLSSNFAAMLNDAKYIIEYALKIIEDETELKSKIVIKIPLTWDGLNACKAIRAQGYKVNMTLCFSAQQALLAAKAGATYVSPFVGRLQDDEGNDAGFELIEAIRVIYDFYNWPNDVEPTKILASSIRKIEHVKEVALRGADLATVPVSIMSALLEHPFSAVGLEKFKQDAEKFTLKDIMPF
jgi:transaldolase